MKKFSICTLLYTELINKYRDDGNAIEVSNAWEKCFKIILRKSFGFNRKARNEMFKWGSDGFNWNVLHPENSTNSKEYRAMFMSEVAYCSDRMTLDRLLRCHHLYRCFMSKKLFSDSIKVMGGE